MHLEVRRFVETQVVSLGPFATAVEFGSRNINGGVRDLFPGTYVGVDVAPGPGVDVVADAATWAPDIPVDCVVCCEVLEHTDHAEGLVAAAFRALRPGGVLLLTAACDPRAPHSAGDGGVLADGEFYRNVDVVELDGWLSGWAWREVTVDRVRGDVYAVARR